MEITRVGPVSASISLDNRLVCKTASSLALFAPGVGVYEAEAGRVNRIGPLPLTSCRQPNTDYGQIVKDLTAVSK